MDYAAVGATHAPDLMQYPPEHSIPAENAWRIGSGEERFRTAGDSLLSWTAQRAAGLELDDVRPASATGYAGVSFDAEGAPIAPNKAQSEQRYDAEGVAVGNQFQVNDYTPFDQTEPVVASLDGGGFVVVWRDHGGRDGSANGVFGQRYDADGLQVAKLSSSTATKKPCAKPVKVSASIRSTAWWIPAPANLPPLPLIIIQPTANAMKSGKNPTARRS